MIAEVVISAVTISTGAGYAVPKAIFKRKERTRLRKSYDKAVVDHRRASIRSLTEEDRDWLAGVGWARPHWLWEEEMWSPHTRRRPSPLLPEAWHGTTNPETGHRTALPPELRFQPEH